MDGLAKHTHNVSHESYDLAHTELLFSSLYLLYKKVCCSLMLKAIHCSNNASNARYSFRAVPDKSWQPKWWLYIVQRRRFKDGRCHSLATKDSMAVSEI